MNKKKQPVVYQTEKVFLDDIRFPPDDTWTEFKDPYDCWDYIREYASVITHISFDHDLWYENPFGEEVTWYDVLSWMLEYFYSNKIPLPVITLHTANPIGKSNMEWIMKSYALHYHV